VAYEYQVKTLEQKRLQELLEKADNEILLLRNEKEKIAGQVIK
jgi:hypothetical protein